MRFDEPNRKLGDSIYRHRILSSVRFPKNGSKPNIASSKRCKSHPITSYTCTKTKPQLQLSSPLECCAIIETVGRNRFSWSTMVHQSANNSGHPVILIGASGRKDVVWGPRRPSDGPGFNGKELLLFCLFICLATTWIDTLF